MEILWTTFKVLDAKEYWEKNQYFLGDIFKLKVIVCSISDRFIFFDLFFIFLKIGLLGFEPTIIVIFLKIGAGEFKPKIIVPKNIDFALDR